MRKTILCFGFIIVAWYSHAQVLFKEVVLDDNAPHELWMKTIGDINNDKLTDIVVGGWKDGGIVAYLAPNWSKKIIKNDIHVSTDAEITDINNDGLNDIVVVAAHALVWLQAPQWQLHIVDSMELHDVEVCDVDEDGLTDIVARNQGGR